MEIKINWLPSSGEIKNQRLVVSGIACACPAIRVPLRVIAAMRGAGHVARHPHVRHKGKI